MATKIVCDNDDREIPDDAKNVVRASLTGDYVPRWHFCDVACAATFFAAETDARREDEENKK